MDFLKLFVGVYSGLLMFLLFMIGAVWQTKKINFLALFFIPLVVALPTAGMMWAMT